MTLTIAPTDDYRVFQRDVETGNPSGFTTTYNKGWGEVALQVTASNAASSFQVRLRNSANPTQVIQDWVTIPQSLQPGQNTARLNIPASLQGYLLDVAAGSDTANYATSSPFYVGNVDVAAGQSKATVFFDSYAYDDQSAPQPSTMVPFNPAARVFDPVNRSGTVSGSPTTWLPPGDYNTPGGAYVTTFAAEYLRLRMLQTGVACALIGVAASGSSIGNWVPGTSNYDSLMKTLAHAGYNFNTFIWCQGDADESAPGIANYTTNLDKLLRGLQQVSAQSFTTVMFDYTFRGGDVARYSDALYRVKQDYADTHPDVLYERALDSAGYFGGHPTMLSRLRAARVLYRTLLTDSSPVEDRGPWLTGQAVVSGRVIYLLVRQDVGTKLLGTLETEGTSTMSYTAANGTELASQFSVFSAGHYDLGSRLRIEAAQLVSPTLIRLSLEQAPQGDLDVWYRADEDTYATARAPNSNYAIIRDDIVDEDGISYGRELQADLYPIRASSSSLVFTARAASNSDDLAFGAQLPPIHDNAAGLILSVSEDAWKGDASFSITIDGVQRPDYYVSEASHAGGGSARFYLADSLSVGSHTVTITFQNDAYGGTASTDRNLYLDSATYNAQSIAGATAALTRNGSYSFTVTVGAAASQAPESLIQIQVLPENGSILDAHGRELTVGDVLSAADIAGLRFRADNASVGKISDFVFTELNSGEADSTHDVKFAVADAAGDPVVPFSRVQASPGGGGTRLNLLAPADPDYPVTQLTITATKLPTNGDITLADGSKVVSGQILDSEQMAQLTFTPSNPSEDSVSTFQYTVRDPEARESTGTVSLIVGSQVEVSDYPVITSIGGLKNQAAQTVLGTGEAGSTVQLLDGQSLYGTTLVGQDGTWSISVTLTDGAHNLTAISTDATGNLSSPSNTVSYAIDTAAPASPLITSMGGLKNQAAQTVLGTGEAGSTVRLLDGQSLYGTTLVGQDGTWSISVTLTDGAHNLTAISTDAAGNLSSPSNAVSYAIDTVEPTSPVITSIGGLKSQAAQTVLGTGEAGSTVRLLDGQSLYGTTLVGQDGTWSISVTLTDGAHNLTAISTDAAGNLSSPSNAVSYAIEATNVDPSTGVPLPHIDQNAQGAFSITNVSSGIAGSNSGQMYVGPVPYLDQQFIWNGTQGVAVLANVPSVFLHGGSGDDALAVTAGSNVLDGGDGSNFLVGADGREGGSDTFFVDARSTAPTWTTVVNFHKGDQLTIWGYDQPRDAILWSDMDGTPGFSGATLRATVSNLQASVTFAGVEMSSAARFGTTYGEVNGQRYLLIQSL